jgi:hypothetical protein
VARQGNKGYRYRHPNSECIAYIGWQAISKNIQIGKRKEIGPNAQGIVEFIFVRKYPRYYYQGKRRTMPYWEFLQWSRASSKGAYWNYNLKGNI